MRQHLCGLLIFKQFFFWQHKTELYEKYMQYSRMGQHSSTINSAISKMSGQNVGIKRKLQRMIILWWPDHFQDRLITGVLSVHYTTYTDMSHELGWSKTESLQGVCTLHRRDAYPNTSTNSWDLIAQECGNRDSSDPRRG